jgi:hypothetical protein
VALLRVAIGVLLIAHGLVHLLYLAPDVPFELEDSWVVPERARRSVAYALMTATVLAFLLVALALWGVPGLSGAWPAVTITASCISMVLLAAYWSNQLVLGVVIDVALIIASATRPEWVESLVA